MAEFHKVTTKNIVGGAGRLVVADYGIDFPEAISDVIDPNTYELKPGWRDLGATNDGIAISRGFDTEDFEIDQMSGAVDSDITSWEHTLETNLAESSAENKKLSLIGSEIKETPPVLGTSTTTTAATVEGATIISLTSAAGFTAGRFVDIAGQVRRISSVSGNTIYVDPSLKSPTTTGATVSLIEELGTKRIGFGTIDEVPFKTYALLSKRKDHTLYMAVIRKAKVSGDSKEMTFSKEKLVLPLQLIAYPDDSSPQDENVYYEIEQAR